MESWPRLYPTTCNCQGVHHKFYKNCLGCGLLFCQQNSKLSSCTFCSLPFDTLPSNSSIGLEKALNLHNRLLQADRNPSATVVLDEFNDPSGNFLHTNFLSASEINLRRKELEEYKSKLEREKAEKSTFDLSKMLKF